MESLRPRLRPARPTRFVRLRGLNCFDEVRKRIIAGWAAGAIAKFIQEDAKEYDDVARESLTTMVSEFREAMPPAELLAIRMPQAVAKAEEKLEKGIDELEELQKLYLMQMERIEIDRGSERKINKLFKSMNAEMLTAQKILRTRAELKMDLGLNKRHLGELGLEGHLTADLTARYGREDVGRVMNDAASRRRVLNVAERLMRMREESAKEIEGEIVDVTPEKPETP